MTLIRGHKKILMILLAICMAPSIFAGAQIAWVKTFKEALKQAANEKKFIVLDISASW